MIRQSTSGPDDWKAHLAQPELHWKPGRSAMEAAFAWEAGLPGEIAVLFPDATLLQAIVEYPVALPGGGQSSKNDVFALLSSAEGLIAVMVEAKRDESFGPTVGEWLRDASAGKIARLTALCEVLGLMREALPPEIRYQLLHRAASAILTARRYHACAVMVIQSFSPEARWFDDFSRFASLMGAAPDKDRLLGCVCTELQIGWASAPLRTPQAVD